MSRAGLLSTCGDPFITLLLIKLWKERWYNEIDHLYINFNNHCGVPPDVVAEFMGRIAPEPKITLIYHPTGIGNGPPQVENLLLCKEDNILLLEDDFFIFTSGVVDGYFKKIESGETDLLGSPRYSYGEVADMAKRTFNLDYSGVGDRGFGWWPTGFYCKRKDLLKTDLNFGSKKYSKGEYFKELDHTFKEDNYTDTFTWTSIQLRAMGLRYIDIPQNHASVYEIEEHRLKAMNWAKEIKYIHGGSLSAGWGGYLSGRLPDVSHDAAKLEMESRCAFWEIASADYIAPEGFNKFKRDYRNGLYKLEDSINVDRHRLEAKIKIYRDLMRI